MLGKKNDFFEEKHLPPHNIEFQDSQDIAKLQDPHAQLFRQKKDNSHRVIDPRSEIRDPLGF
jgi:hypothetical protein